MAASLKEMRGALRKANRLNNILLPQFENLKQRKIGRSAYAIYSDYKAVFVDFFTGARRRPVRSTIVFGVLGGLYLVYRNNPDEQSYTDTLFDNANELLQLGKRIRNPASDAYVQNTLKLHYQGKLARQSLGLFSLMYETEFGKESDLYEKHCYYTKPRWIYSWRDVRDVGVCGHWVWLENAMTDFDINDEDLTGLTDDLAEQNTVWSKLARYSSWCMQSLQEQIYGLWKTEEASLTSI